MNQVALLKDFGFNDNRLPYLPDLAESFEIDNVRWRVLIDTVFPNAKRVESIVMALTYCKARNLDIFKRPVHIVPMWSTAAGGMIDTIWPGISEIRTTAFRTGQLAGIAAAEFGPFIDGKFGEKAVRYPEWCQITVTRMLNGTLCQFVSPKVYWLESYAVDKRGSIVPNEMWTRRPSGQLEKCTEAAALRRAFPEEIGNDYTAEEMEGQVLGYEPQQREIRRAPAPPAIEHKPAVALDIPAAKKETIAEPAKTTATPADAPRRAPPPPAATVPMRKALGDSVIAEFEAAIHECRDADGCNEAYETFITPVSDKLSETEHDEIDAMLRERVAQLEPADP